MTNRIIIFANGDFTDPDSALSRLQADDFILCADGGARHALDLGLRPDLVVGDLDSLSAEDLLRLQAMDVEIERHPVDKDATDLELALLAAKRLQPSSVLLMALLGGRLDQSLANLLLLADPRFSTLQLSLADANQTAWIVLDEIIVHGQPGDTISTLALSPLVEGLTYDHGLRWLLDDFTLPFGSSRGISNELTSSSASIQIRSGILLVVHISQI